MITCEVGAKPQNHIFLVLKNYLKGKNNSSISCRDNISEVSIGAEMLNRQIIYLEAIYCFLFVVNGIKLVYGVIFKLLCYVIFCEKSQNYKEVLQNFVKIKEKEHSFKRP